jgi:creatinine amidohydrolase/Fe(II)-dependent formamide hydrolase-like protein
MKRSKSVEVEYKYLTSGVELDGRIGILPVGSLETHGRSLPYGTDTLIAEAFALDFACEVEGVVFPAFAYGFCPNTACFQGTVSPPAQVLMPFLSAVCRDLVQICPKLVVVNIHNGNDAVIKTVVDDLFQTSGISLYYLNPYTFLGEEDGGVFAGQDNSYKEAALLLASLEVLEAPHKSGFLPDADECYTRPKDMQQLRRHGALGFSYPEEQAHIAARKDVDVDAGLRYFSMARAKFGELMKVWMRFAP